MHDKMLTWQVSKEIAVVGFVDDIRLTKVAQDIKEIEIHTNDSVWEIGSWFEGANLKKNCR